MAAQRAALLLGCYRKDDCSNAEVYAGALTIVLSDYPEAIVRRVTDPRSGVPGKVKWLPSVAEVRSACEAEAIELQRRVESVRREIMPERLPTPEEDRAAVMARLRARFPKVFDRSGEIRGSTEFYEQRVEQLTAKYRDDPPGVGPHLAEYLMGRKGDESGI